MKAGNLQIVGVIVWVQILFPLTLVTGCNQPVVSNPNGQPLNGKTSLSSADTSVIGKTVEEAVKVLHLSFGRFLVIEEPPEVGRGVRGTDIAGDEVWLYIDSIEDPDIRHWELSKFASYKVVGIARKDRERWQTSGKIIWYYHSQ